MNPVNPTAVKPAYKATPYPSETPDSLLHQIMPDSDFDRARVNPTMVMQHGTPQKTIIHVLWNFGPSGAHIFAVNLANEQAKTHKVILVNMNPRSTSPILTNRIHPQVQVLNLTTSRLIRSAAFRIGNWITRMQQNNPLFAGLMAKKLMPIFQGADIVHTHLVRDRFIVSKALEGLGANAPKHIMTDHGGFLELETAIQRTGKPRPQYNKNVFKHILDSCAYIVTVSDAQNAYWQKKQQEGYNIKYSKIYYGSPSEIKNVRTRDELGYGETDFIFIMVARGNVPSKGWELTIRAFLGNNDPAARLLLVGGGSEIDRLKALYGSNAKITFTGAVQNPADLIQVADVGVLASTFPAESLPNSVIEYLKAGKPVIGSDIGDIKNMLHIGNDETGILLPIQENKIDVVAYAAAMRKMQHDKAAYGCFKKNAVNAGKQYDMAYCAYRYATEVYGFA